MVDPNVKLVLFTADRCGWCKRLKGEGSWEKMQEKLEADVSEFIHIDIAKTPNNDMIEKYIEEPGVPQMVLVQNDKPIASHRGYFSKDKVDEIAFAMLDKIGHSVAYYANLVHSCAPYLT